ncbi:MAG: RNA methyltransferase [Eudoraea sp.]|nr:RNA methyltransferase [Eudoraea sp.]
MEDAALQSYLESIISPERLKRFDEVLAHRTNYITVVMEDLYHMHNSSAVIRSCEVFGVQNVHVVENEFAKQLDKKIALGAEKWVDLHTHETTMNCLKKLRADGYTIIGTTPHKEADTSGEFEITGKTALLFGTEKEGLSELALSEADGFIKIPMVGFTESLNVSVAAAIILQDLTHKLRKSSLNWELTEEEKQVKKLEWTKKSIKNIDKIVARFQSGN